MLKSKKQNLADHIVEALAKTPVQTIESLEREIASKLESKVTLQAWYKSLSKLIDEGVVVKKDKRYSLNKSWVVDMLNMAHSMRISYVDQAKRPALKLPARSGERRTFKFNNLLSMNSFWAHILVHIASQTKGRKDLYIYNPHFWFYLAHDKVEEQYSRSMKEFGVTIYLIVGSNSFLNKWNSKFFNKNVKYWLSPKSLFSRIDKYYNLIDDYFIEVTLSKDTAQEIDKIFKETTSLSEISQVELIDVFQRKSPCKITVTRKHSKAKRFKSKIIKHFK